MAAPSLPFLLPAHGEILRQVVAAVVHIAFAAVAIILIGVISFATAVDNQCRRKMRQVAAVMKLLDHMIVMMAAVMLMMLL
jgi:hypothetical protein